MRRRQFISVLGGVAAGWPLGAHAQARPAVLGLVSTRAADDSAYLIGPFRRGLAESGYTEGQNLTIEYRWAEGKYDRLPALAAELINRRVSVIVAGGNDTAALTVKTASATIPLVFVVGSDPVKLGLVASFNRPGGNATGFTILTNTLEPKRLGLLHELVPQVKTIGVLLNPANPAAQRQLKDLEDAAHTIALELEIFRASTDPEIDSAFEAMAKRRIAALTVAADGYFNSRRQKIVALIARQAAPAMYQFREYPQIGGLMSYGIDLGEAYRQAGIYAGRILKGDKPGDLPVLQPTKFEFIINQKTAKALGIKFSDNLLSLADEVLE
jgi:putative ABC transport system substrate-binding protein